MEAYVQQRNDLDTPSQLTAAGIYLSNLGAGLDEIEPFTAELTDIVDKMKEELANEKRILEGTEVPEYTPLENELSGGETKDDQWTTDLRSGFSTIVRIPTCANGSSTLPCSVRPNSPVSPTLDSGVRSCPLGTGSCLEMSGACGCVTDVTNASSECTVPMTSAPTLGMPNEEK